MTADPDNIILVQIRQMRDEVRDMHSELGGVGSRLEQLERSIDKFEYRASHALQLAGVANAHAQLAEKKADLALERQVQIIEDLNRLKARIEKE